MNNLFKQVEMKSNKYIWNLMIFCCVSQLICLLTSCNVATEKAHRNLQGNVYVLGNINSNYKNQVQAIRIDDIRGDTLLVKYKTSTETFLDADFAWNNSTKSYHSINPLSYGSHAQYKSAANLYLEKDFLQLQLTNNNHKLIFKKQYNKPVSLKTHRDPYYAEDGFSVLFLVKKK